MRAYSHWTACDKCDFVGPMPVIYCGNGQGIPNCDQGEQLPEHMHRQCERCKYVRTDLMRNGPLDADEVPDNLVSIRKGDMWTVQQRTNLESR